MTLLAPLWDNLFRRKQPRLDRITQLWSETPIFKGIAKGQIQRLARNMHPRRYRPGEAIFHAGDLGVGVALILEGEVEVRVNGATISRLQSGDFFGEAALVAEERRTADAVATTDCEVVFFLRLDLEEWIEHAPRLGARMLQNLAYVLTTRLRHLNEQLTHGPA